MIGRVKDMEIAERVWTALGYEFSHWESFIFTPFPMCMVKREDGDGYNFVTVYDLSTDYWSMAPHFGDLTLIFSHQPDGTWHIDKTIDGDPEKYDLDLFARTDAAVDGYLTYLINTYARDEVKQALTR